MAFLCLFVFLCHPLCKPQDRRPYCTRCIINLGITNARFFFLFFQIKIKIIIKPYPLSIPLIRPNIEILTETCKTICKGLTEWLKISKNVFLPSFFLPHTIAHKPVRHCQMSVLIPPFHWTAFPLRFEILVKMTRNAAETPRA